MRSLACVSGSEHTCPVGLECPASTPFVDELHQKNVFTDETGRYCNCWPDLNVENIWLPRLEETVATFSTTLILLVSGQPRLTIEISRLTTSASDRLCPKPVV
jgi:hypothetical protein